MAGAEPAAAAADIISANDIIGEPLVSFSFISRIQHDITGEPETMTSRKQIDTTCIDRR